MTCFNLICNWKTTVNLAFLVPTSRPTAGYALLKDDIFTPIYEKPLLRSPSGCERAMNLSMLARFHLTSAYISSSLVNKNFFVGRLALRSFCGLHRLTSVLMPPAYVSARVNI